MQIDWSYFYFVPVCIESFVFVSVIFILVVVVVFLRSRRKRKEDHVMPEEGNGEKYISRFFFFLSPDEIYEYSCKLLTLKERFLTAVNDRWIGNVISTQKIPQNKYLFRSWLLQCIY